MGKTAKRATLGAVSAGIVALGFALTAWAMPGDGHRHFQNPQRMMNHMAERLDLSQEQREQAQEVFDTTRAATQENREELRALRDQLRAMHGTFEAQSAREISDQMGDITADMAFRRSSSHAAIYALLNEEQREEFEQIHERRVNAEKDLGPRYRFSRH